MRKHLRAKSTDAGTASADVPRLRLAPAPDEAPLPAPEETSKGAGTRRLRLPRIERRSSSGLVEAVRLVAVTLFGVTGWEIAVRVLPQSSSRAAFGIALGCGVGYVLGGVFGRQTASAVSRVEREFRRIPASEILAGAIGLLFGLVLATLVSFPLFHLPPVAAYTSVSFIYITLVFVGYRVGRAKSDELFAMFGVKSRAAASRADDVAVLDASALLDGRFLSLVKMGFLGGTFLVTSGVLEELQRVADSSNAGRRERGRRALDLLLELKRDPSIHVVLVEEEPELGGGGAGPASGLGAAAEAVDTRLVRLAKAQHCALITNDSGLARVAAALEVPVRSIHALADALRPEVVAGDAVAVRLRRRGRDHGQAVGYLDDGTMVVVEDADHLLGDVVSVMVTNALQTSSGRLIFGRIAGSDATDG